MMILMCLTGAGVLDDILDGLHMTWGSIAKNLVGFWWVWSIKNSLKDWWHFKSSCLSWWWFWCSWLELVSLMTFWIVYTCPEGAMFKFWLKSIEFKGIKNPLKEWWHLSSFCWSWWWFRCSWLGRVSLMMFWMACISPEGANLIIWLKSVEFKGIKNFLKDRWHFYSSCWIWWGFWCSWLGWCPWWRFVWSAYALRELC